MFWEGSNSANVTADKNGCDMLDKAVSDASMPLTLDCSAPVCVLKSDTVVASSSMTRSADVGVGTLR